MTALMIEIAKLAPEKVTSAWTVRKRFSRARARGQHRTESNRTVEQVAPAQR